MVGEGKPPSLYYTILDRANMINPIEPMQYEAPTVQRAVKKLISDDGQQIGTAWGFLQKYFLDEYDGYFYVKYVKDEAHPGFFRIVARYELDIGDKTDQTGRIREKPARSGHRARLAKRFLQRGMCFGHQHYHTRMVNL